MKNIVLSPIKTKRNTMVLGAPTTIHIELSSGCVLQCRHCYNYWRHDDTPREMMTRVTLDRIIDEIIRNRVMHVIFTGGEPLLNFDNLCHGIRRVRHEGISVSCNSNLLLATHEKLKTLRKLGLEHILTSLNSYDPLRNDYIVNKPGAFEHIISSIKRATTEGIRISVNMIITQKNLLDVYKTGALAASLGAKNFFATRVVPNASLDLKSQREFLLYKKEAKIVTNELLKVSDDFKIRVGSLVPFPLCFLEDLGKFRDFYMHGCPAGNKMISINSDGQAHACVHESTSYGSVLDIGLAGVWKNMHALWRKGDAFPEKCKECSFFEQCNAGCPLIAKAFSGKFASFDILRKGWKKNSVKIPADKDKRNIENQAFRIPDALRFRREKGFYTINRFGSEIVCVKNKLAKIILKYYKSRRTFTALHLGKSYRNDLAQLIEHKLIEAVE